MGTKQKVSILALDDQPSRLGAYEVMLASIDEDIVSVTSVREALQVMIKADVAVVLMDVGMKDSFAMAESIHHYPQFRSTPVLFISDVPLANLERLGGFEFGAVDYVLAPVSPDILRTKVRVLVNRKRMQDTLQERADLLDLASEAIMVRDHLGFVQFWNSGAEELYGWKRDEMIGKKMHQVLETRFPAPFAEIEAAVSRVGRWEGRLVQRTKSGREVTVACRKALKVGPVDIPGSILEVNRDITADLAAREALKKAEKWAAMGQMAGIIAHEINNPLEAILNAMFLLQQQPLAQDTRRYVRLIDEELARVSRITRQVLGFYRESREAVRVTIAALLDDILEIQTHDLHKHGILLEKRYEKVGTILGFPSELKRLFLNLILNAIQAMPNGGRLRVRTREAFGPGGVPGLRISICDTGEGIPADKANRIFEPFFTTKSAKGTGLGLWISKGIVQKHGGTLRFRSVRSPHGGATCFTVFLPGPFSAVEDEPPANDYAAGLSSRPESAA
jgi:two-component system, NtrC family, sensor kinase